MSNMGLLLRLLAIQSFVPMSSIRLSFYIPIASCHLFLFFLNQRI